LEKTACTRVHRRHAVATHLARQDIDLFAVRLLSAAPQLVDLPLESSILLLELIRPESVNLGLHRFHASHIKTTSEDSPSRPLASPTCHEVEANKVTASSTQEAAAMKDVTHSLPSEMGCPVKFHIPPPLPQNMKEIGMCTVSSNAFTCGSLDPNHRKPLAKTLGKTSVLQIISGKRSVKAGLRTCILSRQARSFFSLSVAEASAIFTSLMSPESQAELQLPAHRLSPLNCPSDLPRTGHVIPKLVLLLEGPGTTVNRKKPP